MIKGSHKSDLIKPTYTDVSQIPKEGDTCNGSLIGWRHQLFTWRLCEDCGKGRWMHGVHNHYCKACAPKHRTYSPEYSEKQRRTCIIRNTTQPNPLKGKKLLPRSKEHSMNISKALIGKKYPERRKRGLGCLGTIENPMVGDIRYNDELKIAMMGNKSSSYICVQCPICKKTRWTELRSHAVSMKIGTNDKCKGCNTKENSINWHGGNTIVKGYHHIRLYKGDPFYAMTNNAKGRSGSYVLEHRLIMAKHLGRLLLNSEVVHHINHIKDDNRIENLELMRASEHTGLTHLEERVNYLETQVAELMQTNHENMLIIRMLLWRMKQYDVDIINGGD